MNKGGEEKGKSFPFRWNASLSFSYSISIRKSNISSLLRGISILHVSVFFAGTENFGSLKESVGGNSDEFCAFKPQHALFFVIPAKGGRRAVVGLSRKSEKR
jgi:hypothetical protein